MSRNRNKKRMALLKKLKRKENPYEIEDYDDRQEIEDVMISRQQDFKKINILAKAKDIKKDKLILNKTYDTIRNGFLTTENKDKYIKANRNNFKKLKPREQEKLFNLFLSLIDDTYN